MLKILLVTGRLAEPIVHEASKELLGKYECDILTLPIDVAALITPKLLVKYLSKLENLKIFDYVMVSGAIQEPFESISEKLSVKIVKGPKNAFDIPYVLNYCDISDLSPNSPADEIIASRNVKIINSILEGVEEGLSNREHFQIGKVKVAINPPPIRIVSEITEAHKYSDDELLNLVDKRIREGADIISIGFEAGNPMPNIVKKKIKLIRDHFNIPIALDSIIPSEIKAGVEVGVDMIMSVEGGNIDKVYEFTRDVPSVLIPYNSTIGLYPKTWFEKVKVLEKYLSRALKLGFKHLILDPILEPVNIHMKSLVNSLIAYCKVKEKYREYPLLMGIGNVTELIDADSIGVNALLTHLAFEIGVSLILVVEKSVKCQGSTFETSIASKMATLSYVKKCPPKDLGLNLLILKDKVMYNVPKPKGKYEVINAFGFKKEYKLDKMGIFQIRVNYRENCIEAYYMGKKGRIVIKGRNAREIKDKIIDLNLISSLSHAIYLGIELEKAEIALKLGKNYIQDEELFKNTYVVT